MTADEKSVIFQEKFGFHKKKDFTGNKNFKISYVHLSVRYGLLLLLPLEGSFPSG